MLPRILAAVSALLIVPSLAAAAAAAGGAPASARPPLVRQRVTLGAPLDEVRTFYGRLGDVSGTLGVVVELTGTPAALLVSGGAFVPSAAGAREQAQAQVGLNRQQQAGLMAAVQGQGIRATELFRTQRAYNGVWLRVDARDLPALAALPGVKAIHPMIPKRIEHTTSVPLIGAPRVWEGVAGLLGDSIRVGVIDTGVDYLHTNFGGPGIYDGQDFTTIGEAGNLFPTAKVAGGWDFAGDAYDADNPASVPAPDPDPMDCNGHGSHVAGSAAGQGVLTDGTTFAESPGAGYAELAALAAAEYQGTFRIGPGVAPRALVYALRVFGCVGSTNLTEQAIEWAMDPNGDGDLADRLDVINLSLGSSFGSAYDTSAVAANNAAQAGVVVVASAGNSGDVFYIGGAPGVAKYALSVANSVDSGAKFSAFAVTAAPSMALTTYPAAEAAFGPALDATGVSGDLARTTPANGCTAITEDLTGKIALIDRGTCTFVVKVKNAQDKGAVGVLMVNNVAGFPFSMGGTDATITIPSMMTTQAVGNSLKADLVSGTVAVRLTGQYRDQLLVADPTVEDMLSSSSSRGPARSGTLLKPDIAAPGDTIYSTQALSGTWGVSYGGTSMAAPHVAGIMALLRQLHPAWSVAELKALAMNTAVNDVWTGSSHTGLTYTPTRIGAGRASAYNASQSEVLAYYKDDPGQVSVAFGAVALAGAPRTYVKSVLVENKGIAAASYNVAMNERYQANAGLVFALLDATDVPLANPVTVPAGASVEIKVQATVNPVALTRARDATITATTRQRFSEGGGYLTLTPTVGTAVLRVPVHIAARPAAAMRLAQTSLELPAAAAGTVLLTPAGEPVDTADTSSLVSILQLAGESPDEPSSVGPANAADLKYVGVASDRPGYTFAESALYFGIATHSRWDTPNAVEFDVYVDADEDGTDDYVAFNVTQGFFTGAADDVMLSAFCELASGLCGAWYYMNGYSGATDTAAFNSGVMVIEVPLAGVGLVDGSNTDFNFRVESFSRDAAGVVDSTGVMSYDVAAESFSAIDPTITGVPIWVDVPGAYASGFAVAYDKAAIAASAATGLLLLHHHNASDQAQVLRLAPRATSIVRSGPSPTLGPTVGFTVSFSSPVTGVDAGDFQLARTGSLPDAAIASVSGSGATWTVTVALGANRGGTLRLDLADDDSIVDADATPLGGLGVGNGDFTGGQEYVVPQLQTLVVQSVGAEDGWVLENFEGGGVGGSMDAAGLLFSVGDDAVDRQYRAILSFPTQGLPDTAVVTGVSLSVRKRALVGRNPFLTHGPLLVDVVKAKFGTSPKLQTADFQARPGRSAVGKFGAPLPGGWYAARLKSTAFPVVNLVGRTQFRLRFTKDDNDNRAADCVNFASGNAGTSRPRLAITYYVP